MGMEAMQEKMLSMSREMETLQKELQHLRAEATDSKVNARRLEQCVKDIDISGHTGVDISTDAAIITMGEKKDIKMIRVAENSLTVQANIDFQGKVTVCGKELSEAAAGDNTNAH